jgi:hypothetical protein
VASLNAFIAKWSGFTTSIPGDIEVRFDCLEGSTLPAEICARGYWVTANGEGERILHNAIVEKCVAGPDGALVPLTEGSTRAIASTVTHAGIARVKKYAFDMPWSAPMVRGKTAQPATGVNRPLNYQQSGIAWSLRGSTEHEGSTVQPQWVDV